MKKKNYFTIAILAFSINAFSQIPTNGLVAFYPFNNNFNDQSGNGYNGTNNGVTMTTDRFGISNSAISFNGISYIGLPNQVAIKGNSSRSIFLWVKYSGSSIYCFINTGPQSNSNGFTLMNTYPSSPTILGFTSINNDLFPSSGANIGNNQWHLIGATYDSTTYKISLYVDGVLDNSKTLTKLNTIAASNYLGRNANPGTVGSQFWYTGLMDDIYIYNRVLTQQEINAIYTYNASSQIPTNGLVGYWPFNGNANDLSGSGNNGIVHGATLTTDRFGNVNSAYHFNGANKYIACGYKNIPSGNSPRTISFWMLNDKYPTYPSNQAHTGVSYGAPATNSDNELYFYRTSSNQDYFRYAGFNNDLNVAVSYDTNKWYNIVATYDGSNAKIYLNDSLLGSGSFPSWNTVLDSVLFGTHPTRMYFHEGKLDDILVYNRVLNKQEINALYTACNFFFTTQPINQSVSTSSYAQFTANTNDINATFQWQSNPNSFGWMNVPSNLPYSGGASNKLKLSNVQLSNHLQPFRAIAASGNCKDTSITVQLQITDTCIVTVNDTNHTIVYDTNHINVYDTNYISVTDTLIIKATLTGIKPPNNVNTITVFPNPARDHITINYGNYASMNGYTLKITNSLGQTVFSTPINQQSSYIDLSSWSGKGLYDLNIIDPKSKVIESRKIVLQ